MHIAPGFRPRLAELTPWDMKALDDLRRRQEQERRQRAEEAERKRQAEQEVDRYRETLERSAHPDPDRPDIREHPDRVEVGRVQVPKNDGVGSRELGVGSRR